MPNFNKNNLWKPYVTTPIVFGWRDILENWAETLKTPHQVQVVIDNLQAASDWSAEHDIPLDKFLRYLNYEKEAVQWFIYEIIAMRWMWGESRLDFVSYLVHQRSDLINLEEKFCNFPGANKTMTLRQFLTEHLSQDELEYLNMPPPPQSYPPRGPSAGLKIKTNFTNDGAVQSRQITDPVPTGSNAAGSYAMEVKDEASEPKDVFVPVPVVKAATTTAEAWSYFANLPALVPATPPAPRPVVVVKKAKKEEPKVQRYSTVVFRFCRKGSDADGDEDELMLLQKEDDDLYKIVYQDKLHPKKIKQTVEGLDRINVQRYLSATFRMMHLDTDPYEYIQIQFPHMPMVLVKPKMSAEDRDVVYDAMDLTFENWPTHLA
jgi:hypothetical protein